MSRVRIIPGIEVVKKKQHFVSANAESINVLMRRWNFAYELPVGEEIGTSDSHGVVNLAN